MKIAIAGTGYVGLSNANRNTDTLADVVDKTPNWVNAWQGALPDGRIG